MEGTSAFSFVKVVFTPRSFLFSSRATAKAFSFTSNLRSAAADLCSARAVFFSNSLKRSSKSFRPAVLAFSASEASLDESWRLRFLTTVRGALGGVGVYGYLN